MDAKEIFDIVYKTLHILMTGAIALGMWKRYGKQKRETQLKEEEVEGKGKGSQKGG